MERRPLPPVWQSLVVSFGTATLGFGAPIHIGVIAYQLGGLALLLLIVVYQIVPTMLLFAGERLLLRRCGAGRALALFRGLGFGLALLIFLRLLPQSVPFLAQSLAPTPIYTALMWIVAVGVVGGIVALHRHAIVRDYLTIIGVVSLFWTGIFAQQMGLFGRAWNPPQEPPPSASSRSAHSPPVFLLFFDGMGSDVLLRDGQIDAERFPHFSVLAQDSVFFIHATSNYGNTEYAFPTMLTGHWGHQREMYNVGTPSCPVGLASVLNRWMGGSLCKGSSDFLQSPKNILSLLDQNGYRVVEYHGWFSCRSEHTLCKGRRWFSQRYPMHIVAATGIGFLDGLIPKGRVFWGVRRLLWAPVAFTAPQFFQDFLADVHSASAPGTVFFIHVVLPHEPYVFDRHGVWRPPPPEDDLPAQMRAYERQCQFVDTLLGQFLEHLRTQGLYEQSIIVVTSDQGVRPLARWGIERPDAINGMVPRVPLLIKAPGLTPGISTVDYQHIDFKPTLLDILGLPPEEGLPGVSAFAPERPTRPKIFYWGGIRYIATDPTGQAPWVVEKHLGSGG